MALGSKVKVKGSRIPSKSQFKSQAGKMSPEKRLSLLNRKHKNRKPQATRQWLVFAKSKMEWVNMNALTTSQFEYPEVQEALGF